MSWDWDSVRVFLAIARAGRLSTAARQLGVEHTTVARRLSALEDALGTPLFYRTARGHLLTPAGDSVLPGAEAMERAAGSITRPARERADPTTGRVRIAMLDEYASHWVAHALPAFRARHPGIELQVLVGIQALDLSRGEAELAIRTPRPRQVGLAAVRLAPSSMALHAARSLLGGKRLRVTDVASLRGLPLLIYTPPYQQLQSVAWLQPVIAAATIALTTNSTHLLLEAARAGAGVAVLPRFMARHHDDLVSVSDDIASGEMWLVSHPEFRREPRVRAVSEFLKQAAKNLV